MVSEKEFRLFCQKFTLYVTLATNQIKRSVHKYGTWRTTLLLFDFINLTQVHNFTVSARDVFTFRRLSVFTVSFTGILQVAIR